MNKVSVSFFQENIVTKSSHSTCSDKSLLSMESSEMDEVSKTDYYFHRVIVIER